MFFCLYALLMAFNASGQPAHIEFDHYTTKNGLSDGYINSVLHDSKGFIWIATSNGLNRFDGITFKTYYYNSKDSTTISSPGVTSIVEDSLNNIWVMTTSGVCVYDRKKDSFSRKIIHVKGQEMPNIFIYACFIDSKGFLWFSSPGQGIFRLNLHNDPKHSNKLVDAEWFQLEEEDVATAFKAFVYTYVEDQNNQIWIASSSNQLFYFDNELNRFVAKPIRHPEAHKFSNRSKRLLKDQNGDFIISIEDNGLLVWNREIDQFKLYKPNGTDSGPRGKVLSALAQDKDGLIWIGDRNSEGVSIFNKKTGKFTYCQSDPYDPYSLLTNKINCIYQDNTGSMWVGGIVGINKYSPGKIKFRRYVSSPNIAGKLSFNNTLCFAEGQTGDIWIGTDGGGLNRLDRKTGKFFQYTDDASGGNSLSSNAVISVCEDHEGTLWMGTYHGGLARLKNGQFDAYLPDPNNPYSISDRNVWYVFEDSQQNLWAGTLSCGLELFDRKTGRFYHYNTKASDSTSINNNSITQIYEDSKQNLYVIGNNGVSIVDLKAYDFSKASPPDLQFRNLRHSDHQNSLSSNNVYCVKEDYEGNLWFGTVGSGIDRLNSKTGKFTNYSTLDGLPGNSITSILEDSFHNLWLATDKGLAKFNPQTKEVVVFDPKDGLQNLGLKGWAIKTNDGEMFFGGPGGFNSFYPDQMKVYENQHQPPVVIIGLKIFNNQVEINKPDKGRTSLPNALSETSQLVLPYEDNFLTFEFIALDYTMPEKNQYAYQMEGFDKEWVMSGTKREANYTRLDPGEYTFRVKASNNDGVWNELGTSIEVTILPPWWGTWWFRLLVGATVIVLLLSIYYGRIRQLKNQKILLETLVEQKTSELQLMNKRLVHQAEELNQTNTLLEERQWQVEEQSEELSAQKESLEKMNTELHELNITKDKFFSIIAHDIKNPFTAILGFTSLLEENYNNWSDEMKREIIALVHTSSTNLYELLENLLQWSRSQRGIIEFNPQKIQLKELLLRVIDLMKGTAEAKNITLEMVLPDQEMVILADRQMLDSILRNLIGNALKFTHTEGLVQVTAHSKNGFAHIKVIDNGVGIRSDVKERLFRIDSNDTTPGTQNETGTGLGLILVKEFVEKQGGQIGVDSVVGEGSTFYFTIPSARA